MVMLNIGAFMGLITARHEIFPYILDQPKLIIAAIVGGMTCVGAGTRGRSRVAQDQVGVVGYTPHGGVYHGHSVQLLESWEVGSTLLPMPASPATFMFLGWEWSPRLPPGTSSP